jgi:hypothetical protein
VANMDAYPFNNYIPFATDYCTSVVYICTEFLHLQITQVSHSYICFVYQGTHFCKALRNGG